MYIYDFATISQRRQMSVNHAFCFSGDQLSITSGGLIFHDLRLINL